MAVVDDTRETKLKIEEAGMVAPFWMREEHSPNPFISAYIERELRWALSLTNDEKMRWQVARCLRKAKKHAVPLPPDIADILAKLILEPPSRPKGGQFISPFIKALRMGQADSLVTHVGLSQSRACELVAAAWTEDHAKPLNPKTISNAWRDREIIYRDCLLDTNGAFSFRPKHDPVVDALKFSDQKRAVILAVAKPEERKAIADYFNGHLEKPTARTDCGIASSLTPRLSI